MGDCPCNRVGGLESGRTDPQTPSDTGLRMSKKPESPNTPFQRTRVARCARPGSPPIRHPLGGAEC